MKEQIAELQKRFKDATAQEIISWAGQTFPEGTLAAANSFGVEDMIVLHLAVSLAPGISHFSLDTGRVFQETYDLWEEANRKYKITIESLFPQQDQVEQLMAQKGPNSFYYSVENRKECCRIRKIIPLQRKLNTLQGWITGLRREQSVTRTAVEKIEWDEMNNLVKINPLADWSEQDCWDFVKEHRIAVNRLHKKGFPSIGCRPCTRAVQQGEDIRAGRWWWEQPDTKECGLHK